MILDVKTLQQCGLLNQTVPKEGPNAVPVPLDFSVEASHTLDYSTQQQNGSFSMLQGLFIDNRAGGSALTVTCDSTGQVITCPANAQGYFTALCANPIKLTFASTGGQVAKVFMLNFPVSNCVWAV